MKTEDHTTPLHGFVKINDYTYGKMQPDPVVDNFQLPYMKTESTIPQLDGDFWSEVLYAFVTLDKVTDWRKSLPEPPKP